MAHEIIRLVHIDGTLPNLALMKVGHWHKSIGNRVVPVPQRAAFFV